MSQVSAASFATVPDEAPDAGLVLITPGAATQISEIRQSSGIEEHEALRVRVVGGGCAGFSYDLYFDAPTDIDRRVMISGVDVIIDEMSLMYLVGTTIDYVENLQGAGFKFNNPNTKTTCGCGSSFSV